jgi:hypothetical protein
MLKTAKTADYQQEKGLSTVQGIEDFEKATRN